MAENELSNNTKSFGLSFAIVSILSALLVLLKESNEDTVLEWMKAATGHHWVTHGLLDVVLFLVLGWALSKVNSGNGITVSTDALVKYIFGSTIVSGLLIAIFFLV